MKKVRAFLTVALLCIAATAFSLDSFRIHALTSIIVDSQSPETQTIELGYNDALGILFPKNTTFIRGVEIEIKIPQDILSYQNGMAFGLYRQIQPAPSPASIDYQAEQITLQALPSKMSFVLQIPINRKGSLKSGPYSTVLPYVHETAKGPLLFRLLPIMKGLPDTIDNLKFIVKIKPILTDEGGMLLKIAYPDESIKPVSVRVDENLVTAIEDVLVLSPGNHHLSIVSDDYRNEVRVFTVESARITNLNVKMQDTTPHIQLVAPENTRITVDSKPVENIRDPFVIEPGEHTILFKIGDYELSKQIVVEKGRDYTVSMIIDLTVTENP